MKKFLTGLSLFFAATNVSAVCLDLPTEVNDSQYYAVVLTPSHLDLNFVLVNKNNDNGRLNTVVFSDSEPSNLAACPKNISEASKATKVWTTTYQDSHASQGGMSMAYRVCTYDTWGNRNGKLVHSLAVCNSVTGD